MNAASNKDDIRQRRAGARRTAWILLVIVLAIFVTFFMTGVVGR